MSVSGSGPPPDEVIENAWRSLSEIRAWTPLSELPVAHSKALKNLVRLEGGFYLMTQEYDRELRSGGQGSPFVSAAFWAPSGGAAMRLALNEVSADDGAHGAIPNCIAGGLGRLGYADLIAAAVRAGERALEHATYVGSPIAAFVHRQISLPWFDFCFRSREDFSAERPYGVRIRLRP